MSMKNFNDAKENRTRDLSAYRTVIHCLVYEHFGNFYLIYVMITDFGWFHENYLLLCVGF